MRNARNSAHLLRQIARVAAVSLGIAASAALAQPARIGFMANSIPAEDLRSRAPFPARSAIEEGLRALGWIEGSNCEFHWRTAEGKPERYASAFDQLVRMPVDVLVTFGNDAAHEAKKSSAGRIPIVMVTSGQPVQDGLVASLSRPGGNVTGLTLDVEEGLYGKRLAILSALVPGLRRVAVLVSTPTLESPPDDLAAAARSLGITLFGVTMRTPDDLERAFAAALQGGAQALLVTDQPYLHRREHQLDVHRLALTHRLPALHAILSAVESGGLMALGTDISTNYRRAPYFIDRILRGAKPSTLPIEQPSRLELVLNLRTAKAMGLAVPASLLTQADRLIQ